MIIFDLDSCLANCEHRRHFIEADEILPLNASYEDKIKAFNWKPDWKSFHEACDKDTPIIPVCEILRALWSMHDYTTFEIWTGRCESVREKTENWLMDKGLLKGRLKMRPIGDNTPGDQLKEMWLNQRCGDLITAKLEGRNPIGHDIDYVFESDPKSIEMWRRRGIFAFHVSQGKEEF